MTTNKFIKPVTVVGNSINFRNATVSDAEFIFDLRNNPIKNKFLSNSVNKSNPFCVIITLTALLSSGQIVRSTSFF